MKYILLFLIGLYQKTLSPDHSWLRFRFPHGYCKFYPSCSEYSKQALSEHGTVKGIYFSIKRILSCNPWSQGGIDAVTSRRAILRNK